MSLWELVVEAVLEVATFGRGDGEKLARGHWIMIALAIVVGAVILVVLMRIGWARWP